MDNYYQNCPAKMDDGRFITNYRSDTCINEYIKYANGIVRDDDYRLYLQLNADKLMDTEWSSLIKNDSCFNNACVHTYPLRMDPRDFAQEKEKANFLFKANNLPDNFKCPVYADYRMTETPLQNFKINNNQKICNQTFQTQNQTLQNQNQNKTFQNQNLQNQNFQNQNFDQMYDQYQNFNVNQECQNN